ncbi:probable 4-coumarate--CoA ligase 1 [Eurytemora carolleeae]|uniref:probable 4-coumarate--CoA ligase 1 n=1 Tax=Eurytemora carolleeae TaxID=1294199 RepID=UPI000C793181|nr:probable 4-coumarate--CoA ligase 1 [Eurytemora carolleeae]XP_023330365.1 probable 4-coumarate--CoA ligase 1 [Eurytemora carolleeae]|eukprot:XP_023330363.1 probable 4-coumarate--CoA ligase 1 [Eurytemora affinis]
MRLTIKLLRDLTVRSAYKLEPVPKCTIAQQALKALEINPENPVIIDGLTGDVTTRGQLAEQILRVAGWVSQNIEEGDVIGLSLPNITQYMSTALGSIHGGGVVSLFNPIYTQSELEHTVGLVKPKLIFTSALSLDTFKAINCSVEKYVVFGPEIQGTISAKVVFTSDKIAEGVGVGDFNDTTLLPLSSGTTGLPKAVCLSHKNCVTYNVITMHDHFGTLGPGKNCLMLLPKFHAYGFTMSLNSILKGAVYTTLPRLFSSLNP